MSATQPSPVSLFYSYAHKDGRYRDELEGHLKVLERRGLIAPWHDRQLVPGSQWGKEIDAQLHTAELVLLLISKDFIASNYCMSVELRAAMERHEAQQATVVPIFVRPVDIGPDDVGVLPFMKLQGLPTDLKPVTRWSDRDQAWTNVAKGLRATVNAIHARRPAQPAAVPDAFDTAVAARSFKAVGIGAGEPADPLLEGVLDATIGSLQQAQARRSPVPLDGSGLAAAKADVLSLIDVRAQKRVLWVDDSPENNRFETSLLFKLQIEVVQARSTEEALAILEADQEGFDLVISDWERPGPREAGLALLRSLRAAGRMLPVVYYHGTSGPMRARRAQKARDAGALGEAVLPGELMALVRQALGASR